MQFRSSNPRSHQRLNHDCGQLSIYGMLHFQGCIPSLLPAPTTLNTCRCNPSFSCKGCLYKLVVLQCDEPSNATLNSDNIKDINNVFNATTISSKQALNMCRGIILLCILILTCVPGFLDDMSCIIPNKQCKYLASGQLLTPHTL